MVCKGLNRGSRSANAGSRGEGRVVVAVCLMFFATATSLWVPLPPLCVHQERIPVLQLVRAIASIMQEFTQSGGVRPFGVSLLVAGFDEDGPQLYQVCVRHCRSQCPDRLTAVNAHTRQQAGLACATPPIPWAARVSWCALCLTSAVHARLCSLRSIPRGRTSVGVPLRWE